MERHRLSRHVHERRIQSTVSITENHKFNPSLMLPMADLSGLSLNRRNSRQVHEHFGHFLSVKIQGKLPFVPFCAKMSIFSKIWLFFSVDIGLWIDFVESNSFFVRNSFNNQLIHCHQLIYFQLRMWSRCGCWCWWCGNVWHWCYRCLTRCPKASLNLEPNSPSQWNRRFSNRSTDQSEVSFFENLHIPDLVPKFLKYIPGEVIMGNYFYFKC